MDGALERFFEVVGCRTQLEVAKFLGIRQSSIYDAKKRNARPADWLLTLLQKKSVNPDWVLTGKGGKFLQEADSGAASSVVYVTEIRPPEKCSAQELVNELVRRALKKEGQSG